MLVLELLSAVTLIGAIVVNERHTQLHAFDATLEGTAESIMGAVQEADDEGDNVLLDLRGVRLGRDPIFRVEEDNGHLLGSKGDAPRLEGSLSTVFQNAEISGRRYRFVVLHGIRIIDPGEKGGGVRHNITIVYGSPMGHVWHEVLEAVRFFTIATALLLGLTAIIMAWLVRKGLAPLHELAFEAGRITSSAWHFNAPTRAKETVELQPLATALEAALGRLQRSFEQQRRFTNDAAHELKTDVAIVKSSLQLLSMRRRTVEEYSHGLALSLEDFTRLETTVQSMLTLARLEQSTQDFSGEAARPYCSLLDVMEDAVELGTPLAELKAVGVRLDGSANARVPIDRRDALLLCSNILINAVQHSPQGAMVRMELTMHGHKAELRVTDEGEGIAEEDKPHVFEAFYRGDPSRSRKSGGTGLGLSICKAICVRADGSIEIANLPNGGAIVTVRLPALPIESEGALSSSLKA
ncbi:integral membrane sensor signal transduction histidine kinase [Granulicella sibirica]|uniref:histidine kinase n=1 Tax=Granulicella sibirica TaxID=2479048 RepID=A0A4Q0T2W9_9BACT|nr:integral membrane sensor signal transduction histidine kinase [Granulicella sibirica]